MSRLRCVRLLSHLPVSETTTGAGCDLIGVSYGGFSGQGSRCAMPPGTCLHYQPDNLYDKDVQAEAAGERTWSGGFRLHACAILSVAAVCMTWVRQSLRPTHFCSADRSTHALISELVCYGRRNHTEPRLCFCCEACISHESLPKVSAHARRDASHSRLSPCQVGRYHHGRRRIAALHPARGNRRHCVCVRPALPRCLACGPCHRDSGEHWECGVPLHCQHRMRRRRGAHSGPAGQPLPRHSPRAPLLPVPRVPGAARCPRFLPARTRHAPPFPTRSSSPRPLRRQPTCAA